MPRLEYVYDSWLVRVDDDVLEVFNRSIVGSFRVPLKWAGVQGEFRKDQSFRVQFGIATSDSEPFDSKTVIRGGPWMITVAPADVAAFQEFLATVAAAVQASRG
jgi:hypothetical protein